MSNKDYFDQLRSKDRMNLTDFLCILRDHGVKEIQVKGSSLYRSLSTEKYDLLGKIDYNNIDLLLTSTSGDIFVSDFFGVLVDLSKNGMAIKIDSGGHRTKIYGYICTRQNSVFF